MAAFNLTAQLWDDAKNWISTNYERVDVPIKRLKAPFFSSPLELKKAITSGTIAPNSIVRLRCVPSLFAEYRRKAIHPVALLTGRRGPQFGYAGSEAPLGVLANLVNILSPAGLFPNLSEDASQLNLLDPALPFVGLTAFDRRLENSVHTIPCVARPEFLAALHKRCDVIGALRILDIGSLPMQLDRAEIYEKLRMGNANYFIDAVTPVADVENVSNNTAQIWGALYAESHIELQEGSLSIDQMINRLKSDQIGDEWEARSVRVENLNGICISAPGKRIIFNSDGSFAIHVDVDLSSEYLVSSKDFRDLKSQLIKHLEKEEIVQSVRMQFIDDFDFDYSNRVQDSTIMKSASASELTDDLALAIRNWHRKREQA